MTVYSAKLSSMRWSKQSAMSRSRRKGSIGLAGNGIPRGFDQRIAASAPAMGALVAVDSRVLVEQKIKIYILRRTELQLKNRLTDFFEFHSCFKEATMSTVSVGLVDDHPLMIEGIVTLLSRAHGLEILSTGSTARDIVDISSRFHPDVIIVDLSMAGDVYASIAASIKISPNTKIVAFTAATGVDSAIRALDAGASGYVLKGSNAQELILAVESVYHGETYITRSFASQVIAGLRNASMRRVAAEAVRFSIREEQIVRLLLRGNTNKAIATSLRISEKTVKNYMTILMQKLNARNRLEVVIAAQALTEDGSFAIAASPPLQ